jgi:tetratricopeptide (TPR) repeat protein
MSKGFTLNISGILTFHNWRDETEEDLEVADSQDSHERSSAFLGMILEECPHALVKRAVEAAMLDYGELSPTLVEWVRSSRDLRFLTELEERIPAQTLNLRAFAMELGLRIMHLLDEAASEESATLAKRARYLNNLALRLGDVGDLDHALETARRAVLDATRAADENPKEAPLQAASLNTLASVSGRLGRLEDAVAAVGEAVSIYSTLLHEEEVLREEGPARKDNTEPPDGLIELWSNLALSLKHRSDWLSEAGDARLRSALEDALDAVRIFTALLARSERSLTRIAPHATSEVDERLQRATERVRSVRAALAAALTGCSNRLLALSREAEALPTAEAAQGHFEALWTEDRVSYREAYAASTYNLARCLMAAEKWELALRRAEAAATQYSALARTHEELFSTDLRAAQETLAEIRAHLPRMDHRKTK